MGRALSILMLLVAVLGATVCAAQERADRTLVLESVAIEGNTRTSRDVALQSFPLREGEPVDPDGLLDAVDALRAADLFTRVDFRTEPGTERGKLKIVLVVEEKSVELRFGTGYQDLDGWYLVPAELRFDNRWGRGERLRLTSKIGYRVAGLELTFRELQAGDHGQLFWGADLGVFGLERVYFVDGVEYAHPLGRGHLGAHLGHRLGTSWRAEIGVRFETVDADSSARANEDDELRGVSRGDDLPFDELPAGVAEDVGRRKGEILHAEIVRDTRATRLLASTPVSGLWGRVRAEALLRENASSPAFTADLRGYQRIVGIVAAVRLRGGVVGEEAAFYDRFHLGGLYSVRGFPSQSLAPPDGDTRFWTATLELRGPLAGRPDRPRVAGLLFFDAGQGWTSEIPVRAEDIATSLGFGVRIRVPWVESIGLDLGIPISESPVDESFHANASLGWNF